MSASVKEVENLSDDAKKVVGSAGGPSYGVAGKRSKSSRSGARAGSAAGGDRSFPPGFIKRAANVHGEQLGNKKDMMCFKFQEKGHFARDCPNK